MAAEQKTETEKRIQQMVAFITQEARDKAEEIEVRAKEEVAVELLKIQDRDKNKLREYYKQQRKRVEKDAIIQKQQLLDSYRMKHLQMQDEKIQELGNMAQDRFAGIVAGHSYREFIVRSLIQGLFKIWDEAEVSVQCRAEDARLVRGALGEALAQAKEQAEAETGLPFDMKVVFNDEPVKCSGGVVLKARKGRIVCDNTLDARLKIVLQKELPLIRNTLFNQASLSLKN